MTTATPADRYIGLGELATMLRVGKSTLERMKAAGKLPPHVEITPAVHRWKLSEVEAWLEARRCKAG